MIKNILTSVLVIAFSYFGPMQAFSQELQTEVQTSEIVQTGEEQNEESEYENLNNQESRRSGGHDHHDDEEDGDDHHDDDEDDQDENEEEDRVTICHANNGNDGFSVITVSESAVDGEGNNDHSSHEGDIIPITDRNNDGNINIEDCLFDESDEDGNDEEENDDQDEDEDEEENDSQIVTIIADMIVCDSEDLFPNWGNGGPNVTSATAQNFVASTEGCELKSGRLFQWGDDLMSFPGDAFFGEALGWFTTDPTDSNGRIEFTVDLNDLEAPNRIEMRQVLEEGDLAFTYAINGNNSDSVSAEFYCHDDVLNYDNWDWINNPVEDTTYYCIGFNIAEPEEPQYCPVGNLIENGSFENPSLESGWDVFSSEETGWTISWTNFYEEQPEEALLEIQKNHLVTAQDGDQYVELDSDWGYNNGEPAGVSISQTFDTISGKAYTVEFYTHARPGTGEGENSLDFTIVQGEESSTTYAINGANEWVKHTFTFVAEQEVTSIYFTYTGTENSLGIFLDNVSVTCGDIVDEEEDDDSDDQDEEGDSNEEDTNNNEEDSTPRGSSTGTRNGGGSVLGAFSQGEVLGASDSASCPVFTQFHKRGDVGGDVSIIQQFLNDHMQAGLTVDGVYGPTTEKAVHVFQQKYWEQTIKPWTPELSAETTGRWYKTTRAWANELVDCREPSQVLEDTGRTYSTDMFVKEEETTTENQSSN